MINYTAFAMSYVTRHHCWHLFYIRTASPHTRRTTCNKADSWRTVSVHTFNSSYNMNFTNVSRVNNLHSSTAFQTKMQHNAQPPAIYVRECQLQKQQKQNDAGSLSGVYARLFVCSCSVHYSSRSFPGGINTAAFSEWVNKLVPVKICFIQNYL